jgi:hypothetical protein
MVNPDQVRAIQGDSITTPDVLGVQLGDVNILDDNIANAIANTQTLATKNTRAADTNDGLVRGNIDTLESGLVISTGQSGIVTTPVRGVKVNRVLTRAAAGVGRGLATFAVATLAAEEVELLIDENRTGSAVSQPRGELGSVTRRSGAGTSTTSGTSRETECLSRDASGLGSGSKQRKSREEGFLDCHIGARDEGKVLNQQYIKEWRYKKNEWAEVAKET